MNDPRQIAFAMRRVPRLGDGWRYVPLHQLPEGTTLTFVAAALPHKPVSRELNHSRSEDVLGLPEGRYTLVREIWPCCTLVDPGGVTRSVRPLSDCLAPSSFLWANWEKECRWSKNVQKTETFRLTTGVIQSIVIVGTQFILRKDDLKDAKLQEARRYRYSRPSRREVLRRRR